MPVSARNDFRTSSDLSVQYRVFDESQSLLLFNLLLKVDFLGSLVISDIHVLLTRKLDQLHEICESLNTRGNTDSTDLLVHDRMTLNTEYESLPKGEASRKVTLMTDPQRKSFDLETYLARSGVGLSIVQLKPQDVFFSQGSRADSVFYLQEGRAQLTVVSTEGREAIIAFLSEGEFLGEESLSGVPTLCLTTATAITQCTALKIRRNEVIRLIREENAFSEQFIAFLLARNMRTQADLIDQLFNFSEKRLARVLLRMADFEKNGKDEVLLAPITQEALADIVGTTRSRISVFLNRFQKLGFIVYKGRIRVRKALVGVVSPDDLSSNTVNSASPHRRF